MGTRRAQVIGRAIVVALAVVTLAGVGFIAGVAADREVINPAVPSTSTTPSATPDQFDIFLQAWNLVHEHYVDQQAIDDTQLTYGAIDGMLAALGDVGHSRFLTPDELKAEQQSLSGHLEGIGAEVTMRNGQPTIVAPLPESPAQQAGIQPGDVIARVDGQDVSGLSLDEVIALVRGPAGTTVVLTVIHPDQTTPTDITVVRARLTIPSVSWTTVPGTTTAQLLISSFSQGTTDQLEEAIDDARAAGATSLVLDLRNNPGGILDEAVGVASQFLDHGTVLLTQDATGDQTPIPVRSGGHALDIPLVVLVNNGSASSAEIVAGAIQDHQRGPVVGQTTFGTGTVLSTFTLEDGSAILLGTEQWLTPNGHLIWHQGITPDVEVELPPDVVPLTPQTLGALTPEQVQESQDTQLQRALELLQQP